MGRDTYKLETLFVTITAAIVLILFYFISFRNYLIFHSFSEFFSISIAMCIFMISWNSRGFMKNDFLLFLGIAFFFTGTTDFIHMLSYRGMGVFNINDSNIPTQLWVSARYIESLSFLAAFLFISRKVNLTFVLVFFIIIFTLVLSSIFYFETFPLCFVEGVGLTKFKIYSEYLISFILIVSLYLLYKNREQFEYYVYKQLSISMALTILSELSFTFFISAYGFSNLVGHYFKVLSFYFIYRAVIKTIVINPFDLLFRSLVKNERILESKLNRKGLEINEYSSILEDEIRKRREIWKRLRDSENMLQSIFNSITEPMILMDVDTRVTYINNIALRYYNLKNKEEVIGIECRQGLCKFSEKCIDCNIPELIKQKTKHSFTRSNPFKKEKLERVTIFPVINSSLEVDSFLVRITDITERKILEKKLIQSEKLASIGILVSGIAHEINNPNSFVTFNIPILRDYLSEIIPIVDDYAAENPGFELFYMPYEEFREDLFKLLDNVEHGSKRINTIIRDLKDFSKSRGDAKPSDIDLHELVKKVMTFARSKIKRTVKTFNVDLAENLPIVKLNPHALEQVLINLLINAAQAFPEPLRDDSRVDLIVKEKGKSLIFEVKDNATGIDEETLKRLFDPFFTTKSSDSGTGLGLYISHNLVEGMGGYFEVESEPGKGTMFRIVIEDIKKSDENNGG